MQSRQIKNISMAELKEVIIIQFPRLGIKFHPSLSHKAMTASDGLWPKWEAHQGAGLMTVPVSRDRTAVHAACFQANLPSALPFSHLESISV